MVLSLGIQMLFNLGIHMVFNLGIQINFFLYLHLRLHLVDLVEEPKVFLSYPASVERRGPSTLRQVDDCRRQGLLRTLLLQLRAQR